MDKEEQKLQEKKSIFYAAGLFFSDHRDSKDKIKVQENLEGDLLQAFQSGFNLNPFKIFKNHTNNNNLTNKNKI